MTIKKIAVNLLRNLENLPGWRTDRKIVVFESDDWGSIRMPSKDIFLKLKKAGIGVDNCQYCKNDSLETTDDLSLLFDVLNSVKDKHGKPAVITANVLVANPDFEKIKASDFNVYSYKKITESFKEFKGSENALELWKQGQDSLCFTIQSHGREHLNVSRWMHYLKDDYKETRLAFDLGVYGISTTITAENRKSFLPSFDFETSDEEQSINLIAKDGLKIFEELFGYKSKSFIAPNYTWGKSLENILHNCGVEYLQGCQIHRYSKINKIKATKRLRFTGKRNEYNQIDLARNAFFEPTENPNKDWVNDCLSQISRAFRWKHPAIICAHRVNFMGTLNENNRDSNLKLLKQLLNEIIKKWPNIEFMSSNQLGDLITK